MDDELHLDLQALLGTVIHERYRVDKLLGRGGMGAVFKAHHLGLRRDVAFKVLRPELGRDPTTGKRFEREAHSASRLDHPNCVRVSDFGTTDTGIKYLVMELLDGAELEASLGQPWPPGRAVDTIIQILEGLEHAHAVSVVHRDLKPENVFVTKDYRGRELVKLVDFGIAKLLDEQGAKEQLTRAGMVFGTPRYMSPEQASGGALDERTDLYATGLILYEMLCGHPPFVSSDAAALLRMHILAPPPELPPSVPAPLAAIVYKLLEKSRNDRFASARETITALEQLRPSLADTAPAVIAAPVMTGPASTPSMATQIESPTGLSWAPAAPPPAVVPMPMPGGAIPSGPIAPPPGMPMPMPGGAIPSGPIAPPPGMPMAGASLAPAAMPAPVLTPSLPVNAPTMAPDSMAPAPTQPSVAITHYEPSPTTPTQPPDRRWLRWVWIAGGILLAMMAFGAGLALQSKDEHRPSSPTPMVLANDSSTPAIVNDDAFDSDCSDGVCECRDQVSCELSCDRGCVLRCLDSTRCAIEVGHGSSVLCERVGTCDVQCLGDCRVECPGGGCSVECPHPGDREDKHGKGGKKKKAKKAKRCGDVYLCGGDCDDEDDD